jgi:hypothetical protein
MLRKGCREPVYEAALTKNMPTFRETGRCGNELKIALISGNVATNMYGVHILLVHISQLMLSSNCDASCCDLGKFQVIILT